MTAAVLRHSAVVPDGAESQPVGVVLAADLLDQREMLAIARAIDFPSTAFVLNAPNDLTRDGLRLRYLSTVTELASDPRSTVAAATAPAERDYDGSLVFETAAGAVRTTAVPEAGRHVARIGTPAGPGATESGALGPLPAYATHIPPFPYEEVVIA